MALADDQLARLRRPGDEYVRLDVPLDMDKSGQGVPRRRRTRAGATTTRASSRDRVVLPDRIPGPPHERLDPGASTASTPSSRLARASPTSGAATARRWWRWPRRTPTRSSRASTSTQPSIETVPRAGRRGGGEPSATTSRSPPRPATRAVRPDLLLRLPARHGRPGRHRPARSRAPAARRHGHARRAVRPRHRGRGTSPRTRWRPCSTWPRRASARPTRCRRRLVLLSVAQAGEARLREVFEEAGFQPLPPRGRDADEPHHRSKALICREPQNAHGRIVAPTSNQ